jgi:hypothetical protein
VIVIQELFAVAVQGQPADPVMSMVPLPPAAANAWLAGDTENVQELPYWNVINGPEELIEKISLPVLTIVPF